MRVKLQHNLAEEGLGLLKEEETAEPSQHVPAGAREYV